MNAHVSACSIVVPVYLNEPTIAGVVGQLDELAARIDHPLEVVFVVDGSPDGSLILLRRLLSTPRSFSAQLISLSRNFGAFSAVRAGLAAAEGDIVAIMAADLQEPVSLIERFFDALLTGQYEVAVGRRSSRRDALTTRILARLFWSFFRRFVLRELPPGGVDVFACTRPVIDALVRLDESHSSLIGLLYWLGFNRTEIAYERQTRPAGRTSWSFRRRFRYLLDSVFSFSDLPITLLVAVGILGIGTSLVAAAVVLLAWAAGQVHVAGYTPIMLGLAFATSSILFGLGMIGSYVWRTYENSKDRPNWVPMSHERFP